MEGHTTTTFPYWCALAAILSLLVLGLGVETCAAARAHGQRHQKKESTEFIRVHCGTTAYPRVCVDSLSAYASTIQTSPKQLADAALSVSLTSARSTSALVSKLSAGRGGMKAPVAAAVSDCMETVGDSVDELRESLREMRHLAKGKKVGLHMDNIKTWVSSALTDEDTCMDEFAGKAMDGEVKSAVRGHIGNVARLTSNALALINGLSSTISP